MHKEPISYSHITGTFEAHVPKAAVPYCVELWLRYPFHLTISRQRRTKQGDYRYHSLKKTHVITINHNLNLFSFLITYIHEIAHLQAFQQHGYSIAPHGKEWKSCFRELMQPLLTATVFPDAVLAPLQRYMLNPKASTCSDQALSLVLQSYNQPEGFIVLADLQLNHTFRFHQRVFLKEQVKRTRAWCKEIKTGKYYTVAESALVEAL